MNLEQLADARPPQLIINTTPLGMSPGLTTTPWPDELPFPTEAMLYDLVYNPRPTRLVQQAQAAGLVAVNGMGMLVEQAALAFERWTGHPAPRLAMHAVVSELNSS